MSVLACNRGNCENIMCNRLVLENTRYLCERCYEELVGWRKTWPDTVTDVRAKIREFMASDVGTYQILSGEEVEAEFRRLVGD